MGVMVKAIEYAFAKLGGKFFFKKIPIIGAIISFYDAYESFKAGGPEGIARGILDICSGIASLFPGVGTAIAIGLDVLNAFLFQKVETQENGRTVTKINMRDWYKKTLDVLADHFPLKNIIKFATGIEYISMGRYKQGFTEIAEAFPILTLLRDLVSNPIEAYKETRAKGGSMADLVNNITESILKSFIDALPDTFGIRYQVAKFLGIKTDAPPPESLKKSETINANLTEAQRKALEEAENLRRQQEEQNAPANAVGARAMRLGNFGTQPVDDFIKTSDGKIVIPNKEDSLLGFKKDGPLDTLFNKNLKSSQENTDVLKKYADVSSDMLGKQLRLLDENNKLLGVLVKNLSKPANVVSSPTVINNNFSNSNSLRNLQGAPA